MKELCLKLVNAKNEDEVAKIIETNEILKNSENWTPYGNVENNFGTVTGQSPHPVQSFVEKITNSIDAILMKACLENGEDPKGQDSPKNISEALAKWFDIDETKYVDLPEKQRRALAENIQIIADGEKKKEPNLIIYDNGEGQEPQDFPNTLVSLHKNNKISIHFVQGRYNMGGTAALPFCGEKQYQLIISRRNINNGNEKGMYGFTLTRENLGTEQHRNSWHEYCVDNYGKIMQFESKALDLGLFNRKFLGGTFIKLYSYDLLKKSDIRRDLYRDLNRFLIHPALPTILYDKRYEGHGETKLMHGNKMRILINDRDSLETRFPMDISLDNVHYPAEVFVFKKDVDKKEFIGNMAIVFSVYGQVQKYEDNRFISINANKTYLKDHILVNIDCSNMPRQIYKKIFMSNRASMRNGKRKRELYENIATSLRDNDYLKRLNEERRRDRLGQDKKDEILNKFISNLVTNDEDLKKLFKNMGIGIYEKNKGKKKKSSKPEKEEKFISKRFPTFFRFNNLKPGNVKMCPQNGSCKIEIETDVEDEYLIRPHDKGDFKITILKKPTHKGNKPIEKPGEEEALIDVTRVGPSEGEIQLRITPKKGISVGEEIGLDIKMTSPEREHKLSATIKIDKPHEKSKSKQKNVKDEFAPPKKILVYEKKINENHKLWEDRELKWNETDICQIQRSSNENNPNSVDAVYINMDAKDLHNYIRAKKIDGKNRDRVEKKYQINIYLTSLVIFHKLNKFLEIQNTNDNYNNAKVNYDPEELLKDIMKGLPKVLLHLTTNENLLKQFEDIE